MLPNYRMVIAKIILIFVLPNPLWASDFAIIVSDIPKPVVMSFSEGFHLADSDQARHRRERFLNFFRVNPNFAGNYSEILLQDWSNSKRLPQIIVGTLGAASKFQGNISEPNWLNIRTEFQNASKETISNIRNEWKPKIESGSPIPVNTYEELIWLEKQTDPNSVVAMTHMRTEIDGKLETVFSARKIMYYKGYMLFANVVVDSSSPQALQELHNILLGISIKSM